MKKNQLLMLLLSLFMGIQVSAQITVTGKVTAADEPDGLIGATVILQGDESIGTTTDIDGIYKITVPSENSVLLISYTGFRTSEIAVDGRTEIDVLMESGLVMDEVVVIGYGTQKKKVVTGAISKVKAEDLEKAGTARLESSLQGRTSGVLVVSDSGQPGASAKVRIRGTTSISDVGPLYVVDGVPIGGGIDYLSQSDIESIEVLKDASAGIYGSRASAGVILVTTKKGKAGQMRVNYSSYYGIQNSWRKLRVLNASEYATLLNEASVADGGNVLFEDPQVLGEGTDWQEAVFNKNAPIQNHEISLSAGSERSTYYASFSYFDQDGIVSEEDSKYQRFTARFNSDHKISDRISVGNTIAYSYVKSVGVSTNSEFGSPLSRAINLDPLTPIYETREDVLNSSVYQNFAVVGDENGLFGISDLVTSEVLNPLAALEVQQGFGHSDKIVSSLYGEVKLIDGLKFRTSIGSDLAFWGGAGFSPVFYLNAANRNDINSYNRGKNQGLKWIFTNNFSYEKTFGKHRFSGIVGMSAEKNSGNGLSGTIQDIPATSLEEASFSFFNDPETQRFGGFEYEDRLISYFGRLIYNYQEKYLFQFVYRLDGSSRFGSNNKFGAFPSVSLGWVVTEEDFLSNNSNLNFLKIRGSYGINGNNNIGDFRFLSTIGEGRTYTFGFNENLTNGASPNQLPNPDLKWERTIQTNVGFDAVVFKNINLTFDVYKKVTDGILGRLFLPSFVGNEAGDGNVGEMENTGVELEIGYKKSRGDFRFEISGNTSYTQNEVVFINDDADFIPGERFGPQGLEITRTSVGLPFNYLFGYKTDGLFQNQNEINNHVGEDGALLQPEAQPGDIKFIDFNGDGILDDEDRTQIGNAIAPWTFGFTFNASYKNFDLFLFGQGIYGNDIYNATRRFDLPKSNFNAKALERWTGEGTSNEFPRMTLTDPNRNYSRSSDFFLQNGGFFRIKTLQLGYNLPTEVLDKVGAQKVRVYVSGSNLFTWTKYQGFDPEIGGSGVDRGIYPQARTIMFGLNVGF